MLHRRSNITQTGRKKLQNAWPLSVRGATIVGSSRDHWRKGGGFAIMGVLAAGALTGLSAPALAQDQATAASDSGIEEIVVTAEKRSEKLQDVPLAITALSADTLQKVGATDLRDILAQTAGVTLYGSASEAIEAPVIRGQFDLNYSSFTDGQPNVAVFLDGVYLQNSNALSMGILGLDRVEVIKGPVSALYGRNGFAGAINYVSKVPSDTPEADVLLRFGEYGTRTLEGQVYGPIVPGVLRAGIAFLDQDSGAIYHDAVNGNGIGDFDKKDVKASLDFTPTDALDIQAGYYYGKDHFSQDPLVIMTPNCEGGTFICGKFVANPIQVSSIPPASGNSGNNREVQSGHLKATYDLDFADVSYLGGYNKVTERSYEDFTALRYGIPFPYNDRPGTFNVFELFGSDDDTEDMSHELRVSSKQDQPLRWAGGVDYFQSRLNTTTLIGLDGSDVPPGQSVNNPGNFGAAGVFVTPNGSPSTTNFTKAVVDERTYSYFGTVEYDIIDNLTAAGEFRGTFDRSYMDIQRNSFVANVFRPYGIIPGAGYDFNNYRGNLKYKLDPSSLIYVSVASGAKAGGFNTQSQLVSNQSYGPEKNTTYEAGAKTELFDNTLQLDAAVYHIDSHGLQLYFPQGNGINTVIQNIGGTSNTGFELSSILKPIPDLTIGASIAYTDPVFTSGTYDTVNVATCAALPSCAPRVVSLNQNGKIIQAVNVQGLQLPASSKYTVNISIDYTHTIVADYEGFFHIDYRYQSKEFTTNDDTNTSYTAGANQVNVRVGANNGPYGIAVYVQNLTGDRTPLDVNQDTELNNFGHEFVGSLPTPRIFGGELTYHFRGGGSEAPEPAAAYVPPPAVAPKPAPVAHSYMVFFDFNKSDLTPQAVSIVDQAAKNAAPAKATELVVTGHTDTVGSDAYNMRLSRRRAESVAAELEKQGIASSEIEIVAKGKHDLLVPTKDGVKEPQNRRVTIVYGGGVS
jgi:iron complex outermembrane receptor protein